MAISLRALVIALLTCTACSSSSGGASPAGSGASAAGCTTKLGECLASQQACISDAQGERCSACPSGQYAAATGSCTDIGGSAVPHDFTMFTTEAGKEVLGLCQSWTVNNADELWVNAVELEQDEASHHSNWTFVPDDLYDGPDGVWPCDDRKYSQLDAALKGGVLYAQSTQTTHEVQKFPAGAAVRIPPYSRVIGDVHLLNTGSAAVTGHAKLTLHTLAADDVKVKLVPFHLTYDGLDLPPHAASRFTGNCEMGSQFPGGVLDMKVYYILPHTHALATRFFVNVLGGPADGKSLLETRGFDSGAHGRAFDPPYDMSAAQGFSFGCQYLNPRDVDVKWGFGDQEMCELLGFAEAKVAFESHVPNHYAEGSDGDVQMFDGKCTTLVYSWDFSKAGGPGPK
jgi:hypothetical protein